MSLFVFSRLILLHIKLSFVILEVQKCWYVTYSSYFNMLCFLSLVCTFCGNHHYNGFMMVFSCCVCIQLIEGSYYIQNNFSRFNSLLFFPQWNVCSTDLVFRLVRSTAKLISHIYVHDSIELQNLYLVPQSILLQLTFGQLAVSLLNCFWARFVSFFVCFHCRLHNVLQKNVFLLVFATDMLSYTI